MLSIEDYRGVAPKGSEYKGSYNFEYDRTFSKVGTKSQDREQLEETITNMLKNPNKSIEFSPNFA